MSGSQAAFRRKIRKKNQRKRQGSCQVKPKAEYVVRRRCPGTGHPPRSKALLGPPTPRPRLTGIPHPAPSLPDEVMSRHRARQRVSGGFIAIVAACNTNIHKFRRGNYKKKKIKKKNLIWMCVTFVCVQYTGGGIINLSTSRR